jgi:hypothetical protein
VPVTPYTEFVLLLLLDKRLYSEPPKYAHFWLKSHERNQLISAVATTFSGPQLYMTKSCKFSNSVPAQNEEYTGEMGFLRKLPAHIREIHPRNGIPPEITSSYTRNPNSNFQIQIQTFYFVLETVYMFTQLFTILYFILYSIETFENNGAYSH